jgi:dCMP deaminase
MEQEPMRIDRDQLGLLLASAWALRGTCGRRRVGCVLVDAQGHELGTGYNGPAAGEPHCTDTPCPGRDFPSGQGLEACEAIHAEANALLYCRDPTLVEVAYVTSSPCVHCVKLLMNTGAKRIVFAERYAHDEAASELWVRGRGRTWEHVPTTYRIAIPMT